MSDANETSTPAKARFRVGLFTLLGLLLLGAITVYVNDKPFWWRSCQLVFINVEDATGLKGKSAVRSLGLQIGYLKTIQLKEDQVRLGICITAPVEVTTDTKAYIRGEGFLGDKFVELKPVKYVGRDKIHDARVVPLPGPVTALLLTSDTVFAAKSKSKDIPVGENREDVQEVVKQVDTLVGEMRTLTTNLKQSINPEELRDTIQQLNKVLSNASKTLSPQGGLTSTAQRALAKLEDSIEQMRDLMTRVNQGEGSVGMLLTDRKYADQVEEALVNLNQLLSRVRGVRFVVDIGVEQITAYESGGRGWFKVGIWPNRDRYYLLGVGLDPRGRRIVTDTTAVVGGTTTTSHVIVKEESGLLFTAMLGKVFLRRVDLSIGLLYGDGTISTKLNLWKSGDEERIQLSADFYAMSDALTGKYSYHLRPQLTIRPFSSLYLRAGLESLRKIDGEVGYSYGAGIAFDDEDIKLLFSFL